MPPLLENLAEALETDQTVCLQVLPSRVPPSPTAPCVGASPASIDSEAGRTSAHDEDIGGETVRR